VSTGMLGHRPKGMGRPREAAPSGSYREDPADTLLSTSAVDLSLHAVGTRSP